MDDMHPRKRRVIFSILYILQFSRCFTDAQPSVRLIARYQSGQAEVYTLKPSGNPVSWGVAGEPAAFKTPSDPIANGTFVLDAKTGSILKADRVRLAATFSSGTNPRQSQCFLVTIGAKGARSNIAVTGEKIGKAEWSHKVGNIQTAQVVEHMSIYNNLSRVNLY